MLFICYSRCGTCRKAKKWLDDNGYEYEENKTKIGVGRNESTRYRRKFWSRLFN